VHNQVIKVNLSRFQTEVKIDDVNKTASSSSSQTVNRTWASRVRTGNKQTYDCPKDTEVLVRFKQSLNREQIYKEIEKMNWPFT